jgi:hypothetical protein
MKRSLRKLLLSFLLKLREYEAATVFNDEVRHMNNASTTFVSQRQLTLVGPDKGTLVIGMYTALVMEDGIVYPLARL